MEFVADFENPLRILLDLHFLHSLAHLAWSAQVRHSLFLDGEVRAGFLAVGLQAEDAVGVGVWAEQLLEQPDALSERGELLLGALLAWYADSRCPEQLPQELLSCSVYFELQGLDLLDFV